MKLSSTITIIFLALLLSANTSLAQKKPDSFYLSIKPLLDRIPEGTCSRATPKEYGLYRPTYRTGDLCFYCTGTEVEKRGSSLEVTLMKELGKPALTLDEFFLKQKQTNPQFEKIRQDILTELVEAYVEVAMEKAILKELPSWGPAVKSTFKAVDDIRSMTETKRFHIFRENQDIPRLTIREPLDGETLPEGPDNTELIIEITNEELVLKLALYNEGKLFHLQMKEGDFIGNSRKGTTELANFYLILHSIRNEVEKKLRLLKN
jgi:hypothetical protein